MANMAKNWCTRNSGVLQHVRFLMNSASGLLEPIARGPCDVHQRNKKLS